MKGCATMTPTEEMKMLLSMMNAEQFKQFMEQVQLILNQREQKNDRECTPILHRKFCL